MAVLAHKPRRTQGTRLFYLSRSRRDGLHDNDRTARLEGPYLFDHLLASDVGQKIIQEDKVKQ